MENVYTLLGVTLGNLLGGALQKIWKNIWGLHIFHDFFFGGAHVFLKFGNGGTYCMSFCGNVKVFVHFPKGYLRKMLKMLEISRDSASCWAAPKGKYGEMIGVHALFRIIQIRGALAKKGNSTELYNFGDFFFKIWFFLAKFLGATLLQNAGEIAVKLVLYGSLCCRRERCGKRGGHD